MTTPEHHLEDGSLRVDTAGVTARCTCGWSSGPRASDWSAFLAFQNHRKAKNAKPLK